MKLKYLLSFTIYLIIVIILMGMTYANKTTIPTFTLPERAMRASLISFKPLGEDVAVGLDFELPFLNVPMKKRANELYSNVAMVNINTAALITSALLAGGGLVVSHLFRILGLQNQSDVKTTKNDEHNSKEKRYNAEDDENYISMFDNIKLAYRNASGIKMETTLPNLIAKVDESFLEHNINLGACMRKSICSVVSKAGEQVRCGRASGIQKIIDGVTNLKWLIHLMHTYSLPLHAAIDAGKFTSNVYCHTKFPACNWNAPEQKLMELFTNYVKFT